MQSLPVDITVRDPILQHDVTVTITDIHLANILQQVLRQPESANLLPLLIQQASRHRWQPLIGLTGAAWSKRSGQFNYGLNIVEQCQFAPQGNKLADRSTKQDLASWFLRVDYKRLQQLCGTLLTAQANLAGRSSVPTLILDGALAPSHGAPLPALVDATTLTVPGAGHGVLNYGCAKDVVYRFFKSSHKPLGIDALDAACLTQVPAPLNNTLVATDALLP